jgi:hypothetical protein
LARRSHSRPRTDRHRTFGFQLRHLGHPLDLTLIKSQMTCHRIFQDRQECITVIGITSGLSSERQQRCLECAAGCRCGRHRVRGSRIDRPRAPRNALLDHERSASPVSGIPASSGRTIRHSLNRGGNRQLNRALYTIAITQIRGDTEGRATGASEPKARPAAKPSTASKTPL